MYKSRYGFTLKEAERIEDKIYFSSTNSHLEVMLEPAEKQGINDKLVIVTPSSVSAIYEFIKLPSEVESDAKAEHINEIKEKVMRKLFTICGDFDKKVADVLNSFGLTKRINKEEETADQIDQENIKQNEEIK